jgi:hypothetical protein
MAIQGSTPGIGNLDAEGVFTFDFARARQPRIENEAKRIAEEEFEISIGQVIRGLRGYAFPKEGTEVADGIAVRALSELGRIVQATTTQNTVDEEVRCIIDASRDDYEKKMAEFSGPPNPKSEKASAGDAGNYCRNISGQNSKRPARWSRSLAAKRPSVNGAQLSLR